MTPRRERRLRLPPAPFSLLFPETRFVLYTILGVRSRPAGGPAPDGDHARTGGAVASGSASRPRSA